MIIAGIDYSLTSPAICVHKGDVWDHNNCTFYYMVSKKKLLVNNGIFEGSLYEEYDSDTKRYDNLSIWSKNILNKAKVERCYIEGYAFNAVGRVFQIAENTGLLKYQLWKNKIEYEVFAPPAIKKFATTKGNADKSLMHDSFIEETNIDVRKALDITSKTQWNPLSDIVDSFYICKMGFMKRKENEDQA